MLVKSICHVICYLFCHPAGNRTDDPIFRCGEFYHNVTGIDGIFRLWYAVLFTSRADFLNATSPALNKARQIEHMSNIGVVGAGGVLAHQVFERPVFRQAPAVCDIQLIFVHADLDRHAGLVLFLSLIHI